MGFAAVLAMRRIPSSFDTPCQHYRIETRRSHHTMIHDEQYELGLQLRRDMFGPAGADVSSADEWDDKLQDIVTRQVFGDIWLRPGLDRRTRSLVTVAMLVATNRSHEVDIHLRGALANGVTAEELRELMLQASVYCGIPAAAGGIRAARAAVEERTTVGGQA